jgi:hypothetical protein
VPQLDALELDVAVLGEEEQAIAFGRMGAAGHQRSSAIHADVEDVAFGDDLDRDRTREPAHVVDRLALALFDAAAMRMTPADLLFRRLQP